MRFNVRVGRRHAGFVLAACLAFVGAAQAGEADVVSAEAVCDANHICRFFVSVRHDDAGWDHYANRWQILSESGEVLATRYHKLGIDPNATTVKDLSGRPHYLVDGRQPMTELT